MKLFSYLLLLLLVVSCNSHQVESSKESIVLESTEKVVEEIEEEIVPDELDSAFKLQIPIGDSIKQMREEEEYQVSLSYIYLREYYGEIGEKTDLTAQDWDSTSICSFVQEFHSNVVYQMSECGESGISETIIFPKIETEKVKQFINALFSTEDNTWATPTSYEADGAGCYYSIIQEEEATKIEIYCGC